MSVPATWRSASRRTNVVRAVGLLVGVVAGLPLAGFAAYLLVVGLVSLDATAALGTLWGAVGVAAFVLSMRALWRMPRLTSGARRASTVGAVIGVLAVVPVLTLPMPFLLGGAVLGAAGIALVVELRLQAREQRRSAPEIA